MRVVVTQKVEKEVTHLYVNAGVRYWEDTNVNGFDDDDGALIPCKVGSRWKPQIEIETGKIINWTKGTYASIQYKVCDEGIYEFTNSLNETVFKISHCYVPKLMSPKDEGYGDYIIMEVDENGVIEGWDKTLITEIIK